LLDGWSLPVLLEELLQVYEELTGGQQPPAGEPDRYEDYIRFIGGRDRQAERQYWKHYLETIEGSTLLPFVRPTADRNKGLGKYGEVEWGLSREQTDQVVRFAQASRVTVNTVMQGVWAYLLHRYTGQQTVVFGVTVSGRPEALRGVERRVGMYINTLPLRAVVRQELPVGEWLRSLQEDQAGSRTFQYAPLHELQQLAGISGDWFDTVLVFENYPVSSVIGSRKWTLSK
jgi:hypothetical protein